MAHTNRPLRAQRAPVVLVERVLSAPLIRREAVARGRALLASNRWCHTEEVVEQLVSSMDRTRRA